jgi:acyl-CoA thioester hydrolase
MHQITLTVRDYECDIQGVVNNANYFHYFEHARHVLLNEKFHRFSKLVDQGINAVLYASQIKYIAPLRPDNEFIVSTHIKRAGNLKFIFEQSIFLVENNKPMCEGIFEVVLLDKDWHILKDRSKIEKFFEQLNS